MRKIITILLVIGMCISLIACGGNESSDKETDTKESADKVEVELEYYEEYETLPTADSIIPADYKGKTSTMTGDNAGLTVYKYGDYQINVTGSKNYKIRDKHGKKIV